MKGYWSCRVEIARTRSLLSWKCDKLQQKRIFSKKSDPTSEIFRNKLCSVLHPYHAHTQHSHFGMEDVNCVRKVTFSVTRCYMQWSKKGLFSQYLFPEVNFPQITLATEYLYIIPISRNLLFVFWLEIACARSFPKRRGKNWPWKKSYFFFNKWANKPLWPEQVDPHGTSMLWLGRVFYLGWFGPKLVSHGSLKDGKTAPNWCLCCFWCFQPP